MTTYGEHHLARLPGRAPDPVPQRRARRRARPQARGPAARHGTRSRPHCRPRCGASASRSRKSREIGLAVGAVIGSTKWPSTSRSTSPTRPSPSPARPPRSLTRPPSTASTSCAPACPKPRSTTAQTVQKLQIPRAWSSMPSVDQDPRPPCPPGLTTGSKTACAPTSSSACCAYYLEWHMRQRLAPMLYDDTDKEAAEALRKSPVAKAERSPAALAKQTTGRTDDGLPIHSFHTLLHDLATVTKNTVATALAPDSPFTITTRPTHPEKSLRPPGHNLYPVTHPSSLILSS